MRQQNVNPQLVGVRPSGENVYLARSTFIQAPHPMTHSQCWFTEEAGKLFLAGEIDAATLAGAMSFLHSRFAQFTRDFDKTWMWIDR